jgi:hypothetical protein
MENARALETETGPPMTSPEIRPAPPGPPLKKRPWLSGALALFPGIGNVYNGLYLRGSVFFALAATLIAIASDERHEHPIVGFSIAFVWIFNIIDSVRQAKLINYGYTQDLGLEDLPKLPKAGQGGLLAGILFLVLGVIASLEVFFHVDLSWVANYWPLAPLFLGVGLIWAWSREKRRREEAI